MTLRRSHSMVLLCIVARIFFIVELLLKVRGSTHYPKYYRDLVSSSSDSSDDSSDSLQEYLRAKATANKKTLRITPNHIRTIVPFKTNQNISPHKNTRKLTIDLKAVRQQEQEESESEEACFSCFRSVSSPLKTKSSSRLSPLRRYSEAYISSISSSSSSSD